MPKISGLSLGQINKVSGVGLGAIKKVSGLGLGLLWQSNAIQEILKSGASVAVPTSYGVLSGWTANNADTITASNGIQVQASGTYNLSGSLHFQSNTTLARTTRIRIVRGATVFVTGATVATGASGETATCVASVNGISLTNGDIVAIEALASGSNIVALTNAASFLRITPA